MLYFPTCWLSLGSHNLSYRAMMYVCVTECNIPRKIRKEARIFPWKFDRPKFLGIFNIAFQLAWP